MSSAIFPASFLISQRQCLKWQSQSFFDKELLYEQFFYKELEKMRVLCRECMLIVFNNQNYNVQEKEIFLKKHVLALVQFGFIAAVCAYYLMHLEYLASCSVCLISLSKPVFKYATHG